VLKKEEGKSSDATTGDGKSPLDHRLRFREEKKRKSSPQSRKPATLTEKEGEKPLTRARLVHLGKKGKKAPTFVGGGGGGVGKEGRADCLSFRERKEKGKEKRLTCAKERKRGEKGRRSLLLSLLVKKEETLWE